MRSSQRRFARRGFMTVDVIAGIMLLVALTTMLASATGLRARNAQHLADQRTALAIAQRTLSEGKVPADSSARVAIHNTGRRNGNRQWIEVSVLFNGRHASLIGLAPAAGGK